MRSRDDFLKDLLKTKAAKTIQKKFPEANVSHVILFHYHAGSSGMETLEILERFVERKCNGN